MFKKFLNHCKQFVRNEDGSELMQWAIIIIIVAALAMVAYGIAESVQGKLEEAATDIDNL